MTLSYKGISQINMILALRSVAICIQIVLVLFVNIGLEYQLPWFELFAIIGAETLFTLASFYYYQRYSVVSQRGVLLQVLSDVLFLSLLLYFSGGATNAFVSLLLLPIAIAAVTLTPIMLGIIASTAIAAYSVLLWLMPMHVMHGNMQGHFIGMWINFIFSALVVALVVANMAKGINRRELAISAYREEQLRQEKITSLGVSSAQITHQLATPIATVQLLAEELKEAQPENTIADEMLAQLSRCSQSLAGFRQSVFDIRNEVSTEQACLALFENILDNTRLTYPELTLTTNIDNKLRQTSSKVKTDATLLPAILNLVNNAVRATTRAGRHEIMLHCTSIDGEFELIIRDFGHGFSLTALAELGIKPVASEQGLGMSVLLSHASLERLGGQLYLSNHPECGAIARLTLPFTR